MNYQNVYGSARIVPRGMLTTFSAIIAKRSQISNLSHYLRKKKNKEKSNSKQAEGRKKYKLEWKIKKWKTENQ